MSNVAKIVFAIVVCVCMVVFTSHAASSPNCQNVVNTLLPCVSYLQKGGSVPSKCCDGISSLYKSTTTTAARRAACECLKSESKQYKVNAQNAAALPAKCNVKIGYPISLSTNCNRIQ